MDLFIHEVFQTLLKNAMGVVLLAIVTSLVYLFWRAQRDGGNTFNIFDLVMENGKASNSRAAFMTVLLVSSWAIITEVLHDHLNELAFAAYLGAWVTPLVTGRIWGKSPVIHPEPKEPRPPKKRKRR